jgi:AraC-like DNA-binding protein
MVGELLAKGPSFIPDPNLDFFRENISNYVRGTGGNLRFRARIQRRHIRGWKQGRNAPSLDSLVVLSRSLNVPIVRLLTERISVADDPIHQRSACAHFRIEDSLVEEALRNALQIEIPPQLTDVANQVGYRSIRSLQYRYPGLCREITDRRRSWSKIASPQACTIPVPRDRIESALIAELGKAELTNLKELALLLGLKSPRRFYKSFGNLTHAIVTKNRRIRKQRVGAIENALREALYERPLPTVTEIAQRLGFARVTSVTSRFPELTAELRRRHLHRSVERTCRNNEPVRQKMTEALLEFPPPSFTEVLERVAVHPTKVRSDFPDLWRALRARYVQYKQDVLSLKRQAFADDIRRAVTELQNKGMTPTPQLVLANMSEPQFRCRHTIAKAICIARGELSIEP